MSKACIVTLSFQPNPDNIMYFYESCKYLFIAVNTSITSTMHAVYFQISVFNETTLLDCKNVQLQCKTYGEESHEVVFYEFIKDEGQVLNTV
jgi:hypothetical protein